MPQCTKSLSQRSSPLSPVYFCDHSLLFISSVTISEQLGNLLSLCKKVAGAYSFYLFFEILWKTAIGKFLRDQNIMVQWFGSFNHGYLFVGILTLVQMWNMAFSIIYFIKIRAPKLTCCESKILLFEFMYSSANRTVTRLCNSFKPPSS